MRIHIGEMFDCPLTAAEFTAQTQSELGGYKEAEEWRFIEWINIIEQLIYSEIVQYESSSSFLPEGAAVNYSSMPVPFGIDGVRFGDIFAVKCGKVMLARGRECDADMVSDTYFDKAGRLYLNTADPLCETTVFFNARPRPITVEDAGERTLHIPLEFIDLIRSRVRSEFYKYADEDALASKWTAEYNAILENFKEWCKKREELYK